MKYRIIREIYGRCGGEYSDSTFEASSDKIALAMVMQNCMYGFSMTRKELEESTLDEMLEDMYSTNGDGCDFIYSITNVDTGEDIFGESATDSSHMESWDEEDLEYEEEYDEE